jgi:alginate O-acetyltransferase complex protein AlgI
MLFNSLEFLLLFLPLTLALARLLRGTALLSFIAFASAVFYAFAGHVWFLVPMAITTVLDFWVGRRLDEERSRSQRLALLVMSLTCNLGLLAYFKYSGLIVRTIAWTGVPIGKGWLAWFDVVLPAGISFYTFQTMSYVIDIYRRHARAEPQFAKYLCFVSFFPHLVAGPLTRHDQLLPQLGRIANEGIRPRWQAGLFLFSIGLIKKVLVADRIAQYIDPQIAALSTASLAQSWLALLGYSLQIYYDFSGYSDMAIGLGRLFGIELPQNFDSPYQSLSPSDFWRRWHITLSLWLRDYLYISLGGNRGSERRVAFNLMATMVLGGMWHGASWTFGLWGAYHGALLIVHRRFRHEWERLPTWSQRALTYVAICLGWVFFRAETVHKAKDWFAGLAGLHGAHWAVPWQLTLLVSAGLGIAVYCRNAQSRDLDRLATPWTAVLGLATAVAVVFMNYSSRFLYFQF